MLSPRLISLLFFFFLILNLTLISHHGTNAQQNFLKFFCGNSTVDDDTTNSTFKTNLKSLLFNISSDTKIDYGFYNFSSGQNSDKVNVIGLCRGDVKVQDCRSCLTDSRVVLLQVCAPNVREAIGWYDNCFLRYSNRTIFGVMQTQPYFYLWNTQDALQKDQFKFVVTELMKFLREKAAAGDSIRKFAAANATGPSNQTIYGLAQCTPDLSSKDCNICLNGAISEIPKCCDGMKGGRVVRPSCNIRYETYSFFDPAASQPFTSPPLPPSPPVVLDSIPKQGKCNSSRAIIAVGVPIIVLLAVLIFVVLLKARRAKNIETNKSTNISCSELENEVQKVKVQQEQSRLQQQQMNAALAFLLQNFEGQLPSELVTTVQDGRYSGNPGANKTQAPHSNKDN
ncbi:cysteine-rich repeat secretory protein 38 [Neltuma alba]|uniref:cysteine-rich repeat secretory protein 38 n=1 Tax=Neltuma alba TaxID=207710 RepID=UPI0010A5961A|nr:cysteine-rich repeat secretory protein 38-like [Prosopis alba]